MLNDLLLLGLVAFVLTLVLTPASMYLAKMVGAIDHPGGRRVHLRPIPRLGGIAMYVSFVAAVMLFMPRPLTIQTEGLIVGSTILLVVGIYDDIKGVSPKAKFLGQLAGAAVLLFFGYHIESLTLPVIGPIPHLGAWGTALVLFWVVSLVNTVNVADGLDGLAAGISFGACLVMAWSAVRIGQSTEALMLAGLAGVCLGFLLFNFHPAKVFMGDSGSMFLGFVMAATSVSGLLKTPVLLGLVLPMLALGMPIFDMTFTVIRRKWKGQPISVADRGHLHHRLLDRGFSHRQAVLAMYALSAILGGAAVLAGLNDWQWAVFLTVLVCIVLVTVLFGKRHVPVPRRSSGK